MIPAYDETYLPDAMANLAGAFDYALNDCGLPVGLFMDFFATSEAQLHTALATIEELGERRVFPKAIVTRVERAPRFWPAEPEHHDYYVNNSDQPYCQYVVAPKITKFRSHFDLRRWPEGSR